MQKKNMDPGGSASPSTGAIRRDPRLDDGL
jgi:hypothetical protein